MCIRDSLSGGIDASGIITASQFSGPVINDNSDIQTRNLKVLGITTFSGNVSIAGTLTYEDVTHVDSTGISTFNDGVHISGIVTAKPGAAVTYYGDGSNLTGIAAGSLDDGTDINPRNINVSGVTTFTNGNVNWLNSRKAQFGTNADLQIEYTGSSSQINETTGELYINSNNLHVRSWTGGEDFLQATVGAGVSLSLIHI